MANEQFPSDSNALTPGIFGEPQLAKFNRIDLSYICGRYVSGIVDNTYDLGSIPGRGGSTLRFEAICPDCGWKYQVSLQIETIDYENA
jgi:hypothetical protein